MGIFSIFGKKDRRQAKPAEKDPSRTKRSATTSRSDDSRTSGRATGNRRDADLALATALKIDAIESEMSSEFVNVTTTKPSPPKSAVKPPSRSPAKPKAPSPAPDIPPAAQKSSGKTNSAPALATVSGATLPSFGHTTQLLLDGQSAVVDMAAPSSEAAAVIEEAAIMYANGQTDVVEQMLQSAIQEDKLGNVAVTAWLMLFDLYRITRKQQAFENLAIDYLNKFETSPPAWTADLHQDAPPVLAKEPGTTPMVSFSGKLDGGAARTIDRIKKFAETYRSLRLEFVRVSEVDPEGCALLLGALKTLQKSGHELILVGAPDLVEKIRSIIQVGRRDDTEDAWLLLLELLCLLNREKEFEELSIDYCVTFEVSPPAFVAPQTKVTTAVAESTSVLPESEGFAMPAVIEGRIDNLIVGIAAYSDEHEPAIIDCSQLIRIDFNAAGRLLTGLAPFCNVGKVIELHHVNHLVAELLNVIGLKDIVRIFPRKN